MKKTVEIPLLGHPDKLCDRIAEAIIDEYLRRDPRSLVDIQVLGAHGMVMIGGIADSRADFDATALVKRVYSASGYSDDIEPFVQIERGSEEERRMVVRGGARDALTVRGYATKETRELLPRPTVFALELARRIDALRFTENGLPWLQTDGVLQLTMDGTTVENVNIFVQHMEGIETAHVQTSLLEQAIWPIFGKSETLKVTINPMGPFTVGGFHRRGGSSGKWTSADTYGGLLPESGLSFIGKDPRHPALAGRLLARFAARELVEEFGGNVLISATYQIGKEEPVIIEAVSGNGKDLSEMVKEKYDFRPNAIVERFSLTTPMYESIAFHGIFGRPGLPWETGKNA